MTVFPLCLIYGSLSRSCPTDRPAEFRRYALFIVGLYLTVYGFSEQQGLHDASHR